MKRLLDLAILMAAALLLLHIYLDLRSLSHGSPLDDCGQVRQVWQAIEGRPYAWGAQGPDSFDCSGAIYFVQRSIGAPVPRTTAARYWVVADGDPVHWGHAGCGYWIWWTLHPGRPYGHMGMHSEQPVVWHAGNSTGVTSVGIRPGGYWDRHFEGSKRP